MRTDQYFALNRQGSYGESQTTRTALCSAISWDEYDAIYGEHGCVEDVADNNPLEPTVVLLAERRQRQD